MKQYLFQSVCALSMTSAFLSAKATPMEKSAQQVQKQFQSFTGKILGEKVRMRLMPNLEGHIVQELSKGDIFAVVDQKDGYYGIIPSQNIKAYIYRTYVLDNKVDAEHVNVRLEPSTDSPIIAQLNSGDPVEVKPTPKNPKWYETSLPADTLFWVAEEYVEKVGPVEYAKKFQERHKEAIQLLETASLVKQTEFRKDFMEVDLQRLTHNYLRVKKEFPDMEDVSQKADEEISALQKEYCDLKIAFLENQAGRAVTDIERLNAQLALKEEASQIEKEEVIESREIEAEKLTFESPQQITDKMKVWQPLEVSQYQLWASNHPEGSIENFYGEQALNSDEVQGIIEPFNTLLKHKPGDFMLTHNGKTVAYLYSTHVNLQEYVGKKVSMKVTQRDNRNFAFPAYYVLTVEN